MEDRILRFWKENEIFHKSVQHRPGDRVFSFYEGPPTANGRPGVHHVLSRVFKDVIPRYRTMRGYRVPRKAGWDTHGLPVELEIERELGLTSKSDIERFGIEEFNRRCRASVENYVEEWNGLTERIVQLEGQADAQHDAGLKELFHDSRDAPMRFIIGQEIFSHLEKIMDRFEDVANEVQGLSIDHA